MPLSKKNNYYLLAVLFFVLLAVFGCTDSEDLEPTSPVGIVEMSKERRQMPVFSLPSLHTADSITTSESLKGKVVLISFFASWCRSCLEEIPLLKKMQTMFGAEDFAVVAMAIDYENIGGIKKLIKKQKINYKVLLTDEATKQNFGGIVVLPTMFLVNREGLLLKKYFGHIERDSLVEDIAQTLEH
jgi:thiol-disulfide isomerase/thioredoxin